MPGDNNFVQELNDSGNGGLNSSNGMDFRTNIALALQGRRNSMSQLLIDERVCVHKREKRNSLTFFGVILLVLILLTYPYVQDPKFDANKRNQETIEAGK